MKEANSPEHNASIEDIIILAVEAHRGAVTFEGIPVIYHPLTVGLMGRDDRERAVGFLHDTLEDTDMTAQRLLDAGVDPTVVEAVELLTKPKEMDYYDYVQRIIDSGNRLAQAVKLNDLTHNLQRGHAAGKDAQHLVEKHQRALDMFHTAGLA